MRTEIDTLRALTNMLSSNNNVEKVHGCGLLKLPPFADDIIVIMSCEPLSGALRIEIREHIPFEHYETIAILSVAKASRLVDDIIKVVSPKYKVVIKQVGSSITTKELTCLSERDADLTLIRLNSTLNKDEYYADVVPMGDDDA